jgi:apolipoprotein N-acyltransferase
MEIAFPLQLLKYTRDSNLIINISDDGWFGKSTASAQQAQMARFCALETGRFTLLSGNTGITGIVDPRGNFTRILPPHQEGDLIGAVTPMKGNTPLMRFNYYPLLVIIIILLGSVGILPSLRSRHKSKFS